MGDPKRYPVPAAVRRCEETIERSRFIVTVARADSAREAEAFIQSVRSEFADATHHCWAYVAGPPGDTIRVGMSDAGEPRGTAGRPMLAVLLGSGVGNIVAVVTRYFGGTRLGKGGLVRAYGGVLKSALKVLTVEELVAKTSLEVVLGFAALSAARRVLAELEASIVDERYGADVTLTIAVPVEKADSLAEALAGATSGRARIVKRA